MELTDRELIDLLRSPFAFERVGTATQLMMVELDVETPVPDRDQLTAALDCLPAVVVGVVARGTPIQAAIEAATGAATGAATEAGAPRGAAPLCDVVIAADDPATAALRSTVAANPHASIALAVLLRGAENRSVGAGLAAESAVYSLLQGGPEFAAWRTGRPVRRRPSAPGPAVEIDRDGDVLRLTLARPEVRNAYDRRMRDELIAGLTVAAADPSIARVVIEGRGDDFCSGGDLDEFGSRSDPAAAHLIRLAASGGRAISAIAAKVEVHLHGSCFGSGIELPAFAGTVRARPDTVIALPEIALGLIPGAGGTVSLPARIGRQRTAYLALTGRRIDAPTARRWGLVDALID